MVPGGSVNLVGGDPVLLIFSPNPSARGQGMFRGVRAIPVWESVFCSPSRARGLSCHTSVSPVRGGQVMARARKQVHGAGQADTGKQGSRAAKATQGDLVITHQHAAGIDIHAAEHFVAVASADMPAGFVNPD